ncbi:MAG: MFS transporter [Desulfobacterales bacterium]
MTKDQKSVWGWVLYDWANSTFSTTIMAGFFPIFFKQYWSYGTDVNVSTAQLGLGNSVASLIVALIAPILGAIADKGASRKKFLIFFAYSGVLMTAALVLVPKGNWLLAIIIYATGVIGFSGANIFYDSLLPSVARGKNIDFISSLGFSMGYLGGGLLFLINVIITLYPQWFGLEDASQAVRLAFIMVALWWGGFTVFTISWTPEDPLQPAFIRPKSVIIDGLKQLSATLKKLRHLKMVVLFLFAYWCYIDGVDTIIRMAVDYGLSLGFSSTDLIIALLIVQFIGFPAALAFSKLSRWIGVRKAIFSAIGIYLLVTLYATQMTHKNEFYVLAIAIGLVQGGIQALSRSYYSRLIPKSHPAEFYGFYNMLGKFAAIIGPGLMGFAGLFARKVLTPPEAAPAQIEAIGLMASRWAIASVSLLFITGAILFYFVDEQRGKSDALAFEKEMTGISADIYP